ncbi:hypothetical protein LCGC14_1433040, partial [marine sediment metagenome]
IGATTISATQWGYLGACGVGGGQIMANLTTGESTQLEAIGTTTITAGQWGILGGLAGTLTATELNYVDGVTSAIQTQLNAKLDDAADEIKNTHIDWGSGAGQVDADDVPESATRFWGAETGATADQTGVEIVTLLEALAGAAKLSHDSGLSDISSDDHHAQTHTIVSHDTTATGANLNTLTDDSMADTLHRHSELSASDGTPDAVVSVDSDGILYADAAPVGIDILYSGVIGAHLTVGNNLVVDGNVGVGISPTYRLQVENANVGGSETIWVKNTDNSNIASHARMYVQAGGTSGGDAFVVTSISGGVTWSMGVDNSDSDNWKLSATTGLGTPRVTVTSGGLFGIGVTPLYPLHVDIDSPASQLLALYEGTSAATYIRIGISADTGEDAQVSFMEAGSTKWSIGNRASDDSFHIATGVGGFGEDELTIYSTGNVDIAIGKAGSTVGKRFRVSNGQDNAAIGGNGGTVEISQGGDGGIGGGNEGGDGGSVNIAVGGDGRVGGDGGTVTMAAADPGGVTSGVDGTVTIGSVGAADAVLNVYGTINDLTPYWTGPALPAVQAIKADGKGDLDHDSLPLACQSLLSNGVKGRNIGMTLSLITKAVQELAAAA